MSNKIDNTFGAGSAYTSNTEKQPRERASNSKAFGDFLAVDERDEYRSQAEGSSEGSDEGETVNTREGASPFSPVFRSLGSSRDDDNDERNDSGSNTAKPSTNRTDSRSRSDDENKPDKKAQQKAKYVGKDEEIQQPKQKEKLKDPAQHNPLPAFHVPMQVDGIRGPIQVEKSAPVMPTKMIDQIVQEVRLGINALGEAEFQFDLKSDVLEGLKLKISSKDGRVSAAFIAENVHVKDTIDKSAQELIKALQMRGLEVANFQVSVGADTSGSGQGQQQEQQQSYAQRDNYSVQSNSSAKSGADEPEGPDTTRSNTKYTI